MPLHRKRDSSGCDPVVGCTNQLRLIGGVDGAFLIAQARDKHDVRLGHIRIEASGCFRVAPGLIEEGEPLVAQAKP